MKNKCIKIGDNLTAQQKAILFDELAHKIIEKACKDYILALKGNYKFLIKDCENFFNSQWFDFLSKNYSGDYLMRRIKNQECTRKRIDR